MQAVLTMFGTFFDFVREVEPSTLRPPPALRLRRSVQMQDLRQGLLQWAFFFAVQHRLLDKLRWCPSEVFLQGRKTIRGSRPKTF